MRKLMIVLAASAALAVPRPAKPAAADGNLARSVRATSMEIALERFDLAVSNKLARAGLSDGEATSEVSRTSTARLSRFWPES